MVQPDSVYPFRCFAPLFPSLPLSRVCMSTCMDAPTSLARSCSALTPNIHTHTHTRTHAHTHQLLFSPVNDYVEKEIEYYVTSICFITTYIYIYKSLYTERRGGRDTSPAAPLPARTSNSSFLSLSLSLSLLNARVCVLYLSILLCIFCLLFLFSFLFFDRVCRVFALRVCLSVCLSVSVTATQVLLEQGLCAAICSGSGGGGGGAETRIPSGAEETH